MDDSYLLKMNIALRKIIQSMDIHSKKMLKLYGITGSQIYLLRIIKNSGDITISGIAKKASLRQATVTDILSRLEKAGCIIVTKGSADKRNKYISLTEKSEKILANKPSLFENEFTEKISELNEWECNYLLSAVQRISALMNTEKTDF
ncbi:MAG: MarR family transcriptional regulator [Spirochaetia bacterium]|jgi:DNA-binding MarR family transcriptional regulator|nr:MarR family transcriptional regulator [Spirochaetia bacterium]